MRMCNWKEVNVMKKSLLFYSLSGLMALAGLTGCEEKLEEPINPAKVGDEINFGISSNESAITRTIYDDEPTTDEAGNTYYRVTWEPDGSDQIAIYCPQAQGTTLCNYSVTPNTADPTKSSAVTKVNANESGLLWGESDPHHFYGFYPASAVKGTEDGKIRGHIPVTQTPTGWKEVKNDKGGTTIYGTANTDYAFMWAYGCFNRIDQPEYTIPLTFHPWVTILEIRIPGPAENTGNVSISNINIRATEGSSTVLSGDFICDMTPVEADPNAEPVYTPVEEESAVRNTISIPCYREDKKDFVELGPNDELVVRAYLLPYEIKTDTRTLEVRVSPVSRPVLTKTLRDPQQAGGVIPHKVNTVILPPVENREGNNYWLSSLDPNIYLSEISLPGSWNSNIVGDGNNAYQSVEILDQFNSGIRGFMISTGALINTDGGIVSGYEFVSGDVYEANNGNRTSTKLSSILTQLSEALANAKSSFEASNPGAPFNEFVFVSLTYDGGAVEEDRIISTPRIGREEGWILSIQDDMREFVQNNTYGLYTDPITADTKISDVAGKIILKVNTNSDEMDSYIAANAGLPSLFTRWYGGYLEDGTPMRWGSPNHDNTANLTWFYQEVGNILKSGPDQGATSTSGKASLDEKKQWISNVFQKSVTLYEQGSAHDTWFFNCLGGNYENGTTHDAKTFTDDITPWAIDLLQLRTENASLGLVYMNHADANSISANLIQTIIDNNFKFELRKAGNE